MATVIRERIEPDVLANGLTQAAFAKARALQIETAEARRDLDPKPEIADNARLNQRADDLRELGVAALIVALLLTVAEVMTSGWYRLFLVVGVGRARGQRDPHAHRRVRHVSDDGPDTSASRRTKQAVAVLIMVTTVIGGIFGVLAERASDDHEATSRLVQVQSVRMLDERARASGRISAEQQAENTAAEQHANADALGRRDRGSIDLQVERRSALQAARGAEEASQLGPEHSVLRDISAVAERFKLQQLRGYQEAFEFANAYDQRKQKVTEKIDSLLAVIAVLAIGVFLMGLTLAVSSRPARHVLFGTGVVVTVIVTVWGTVVASMALPSPSLPAIAAYLRGQEVRRAAFVEISGGAERDPQARALMQTVGRRLQPGDLAAARLRRRVLRAARPPPTCSGSPTRAGRTARPAARDDYRKAYSLGYERPLVLNNLAVTELRLGDYDAAIKAANGAVKLRPRLANNLETLTSVLRYQTEQPSAEYRASLARMRALWTHTAAERRKEEMTRAIEGTMELAEQDPKLAKKAASYRTDLLRIQRELG